ncbi:MAG: hypothetical protein ACOC5K_01625 [Chloroflexota bacterium]
MIPMIPIPMPKAWQSWADESLYRMGIKKKPPAAAEKPAFEWKMRERRKRDGSRGNS